MSRTLRGLIALILLAILLNGSVFGGVLVGEAAAATAANGVVYVEEGTDNLRAVGTAGNVVTYDTDNHGIAAIGPRTDFDNDDEREVPYINDNGKVYIIGDSDSSPTKYGDFSSVTPRTNYGRLAIGDWDSDGNYDIFFAPNSETDTIYRVDSDEKNSAPEAIDAALGGDTARAIIASTDITGDDIREIIVLDSSSDLHYVNSQTDDQLVAGGSTFWGASSDGNFGFGEPADFDDSGGNSPQPSDYSFPILDGTPNVEIADPTESQANTQDESGSTSPRKSTAASADFSSDGVPDHVHVDTNNKIRYSTISGAPDDEEGFVKASGSKISVDPNVGLASRVSSIETRSTFTSSGKKAGVGLLSATTADTDDDQTVDEITVTFTGKVDDTTVEASDFSLSSGSVDSQNTGSTTDDDTVKLDVSGLSSGDTSVTPDVTLAQNSVDDTDGNTGPSDGDSTVTATDGVAPVQTGTTYKDTDGDGTVDRIDVVYSETLSSGADAGDYSVGGTDSNLISSVDSASVNSDTVEVSVTAGSVNTGPTLDLDYIASGAGSNKIEDDASSPNQAADFSDQSITDGAAPIRTSTTYKETNTDGKLDRIDVVYSETLSSGADAGDYSVGGTNSGLISNVDSASVSSDTVQIGVTAGSVDTSPSVTLSYTASNVGSNRIEDDASSPNQAADFSSQSITDGAAPAIDTATTSGQSGGDVDTLTVTMSENLDDGKSTFSGAFSLGTGSVSSIDTGDSADNKKAKITASGLTGTGVTPDVTLQTSKLADSNDNKVSSTQTVTPADGVAPVRKSTTYKDTNTDGKVDRIDVDYSEDVSSSSPESVDYSIGGTDSGSVSKEGTASVSGSTVQVDVTGPSDDTAVDMTLDYSDNGNSNSITDGSNPASTFSGVSVADGAAAVVTDATTVSGKLSEMDLSFSESVYSNTGKTGALVASDFSYTDASGGVGISSATHSAGDSTATVTLSGDAEPGSDSIAAAATEIYDAADNAVGTGSKTVSDGTDPSFTSDPATANVGKTGFDVDFTADEDGTGYYVVVADGAAEPSVSQVKNGNDGDGNAAADSGSESITADSQKTFSASGLSEDTAYDVYVVAEDASGNANKASKVDQTTDSSSGGDATPPSIFGFESTESNGSVSVTVTTDEPLSTVEASLSGPDATTLSTGAFAENQTISTYVYTATYDVDAAGTYTAELIDATDDAGNEGADGETATTTVAAPSVPSDEFGLQPADDDLEVSFVADTALDDVAVSVDGPETRELSADALTETKTVDGNYRYAGTVDVDTNGTYTATLETAMADGLDGAAGQSSTATLGDVESPSLGVAPAATSHLVSPGSELTLFANSRGGTDPTLEWDWDGDGTVDATGESVTTSFSEPGTQSVELTATDGERTVTESVAVTVEDETPPTVELSGLPDSVAVNAPFSANASGSSDNVGVDRIEWDWNGDSIVDATGPTATHTYTTPGEYTVTVTVVDEAGNEATADRSVRVDGPAGSLSNSTVEFGTVSAGARYTKRVTVSNDGTEPLAVTGVVVRGDDALGVAGAPAVVPPGGNVALPVRYAPNATGQHDGTAVVSTNGTATDGETVALDGRSVEAPLTADAAGLDFGTVPVGERATRSVALTNTGEDAVDVESVSVTGPDAGLFAVADAGDLPATVPSGETRRLTVAFEPDAPGGRTAMVELTTGDGTPITVGLEAIGAGPSATFTTETVRFADVSPNATATTAVGVYNDGTRPLAVENMTVTGPDESVFRVTEAPATIPAGQRAAVELAFSPTRTGRHVGRLLLESNASGVSSAELDGETSMPTIAVDRWSLNFGNVTLGETVRLNLTVRNLASSSTDLKIQHTPIVGADPGSFAIVGGGAPATLAPGDRQNITVAFTPRSGGTKRAQIQLLSNAEDHPQITVWLSNDKTYIIVQQIANERVEDPTVNVEARNVDSNESLNVNVSQPATRARNVTLDELAMDVRNRNDFDINITYDDEPPTPNAAVHPPDEGRKNLQYVRLNHSVESDATYRNTSVRYRVDKSSLPDGADPDTVELTRWDGTTWNYSATGRIVEETDEHYVYRVEPPGFSQFVVTGPTAATVEIGSELTPSGGAESDSADTSVSESTGTGDGFVIDLPWSVTWVVWFTGLLLVVFVVLLAVWRRRDDEDEESEDPLASDRNR